MEHKLAYTVQRGTSYFYNRRVPKEVADSFGKTTVRVSLGRDRERAEFLSAALTEKLSMLWSAEVVQPVDIQHILKTLEPKSLDLLSCAELYLRERNIDEKPVRLAMTTLTAIAGNKDIGAYTRTEARRFVESLLNKGNKSATVRRRVQSLHAVFEFGFHELDQNKRNPFARLTIPMEGKDATRRGVFSGEQLTALYASALASGKDTRLILPILGETGARLAEVVGLRWEDVCLTQEAITITPHEARSLKTAGSERQVPLVGAALEAMRRLHKRSDGQRFVFPRWVKDNSCLATYASNTLNKHIRQNIGPLTCHCFRHTMRDRLRNAGAPMELIDGIGGWSSVGGVGTKYGHGYDLERKRDFLGRVTVRGAHEICQCSAMFP